MFIKTYLSRIYHPINDASIKREEICQNDACPVGRQLTTLLTFKLRAYAKLNCLKWNCF